MSKINAIRLINLNYNNNAIKISDETFHMNGESTLLSLRNGGGKSVLVQMIMAPFVHKRYRDAKDRPFQSYFTTSRPTLILVEWALDHGAGFVMTGMMVRRRQEINEETADDLETIQFITEYRQPCAQDIHHLPVVEKRKKELVLKNFSACRQLFDSYKKDPGTVFFSYDMGNSSQARQYFDKLLEYQINCKEWETIIKRINLKESGLSDLFADCKDEKGLVEKWLLFVVENKLNQEKNRMKEFQTILEKYVSQYKDNQSKIKRRDTIRRFREESETILDTAQTYAGAEAETQAQQERIGVFLWQLETAKNSTKEHCGRLEEKQQQVTASIDFLRYQQISKSVYEAMDVERYHRANREMIQLERDAKEAEYEQAKHLLHLMDCARQQMELDELEAEHRQYEQQLSILNQKEQDFGKERHDLGCTLKQHYEAQSVQNEQQVSTGADQLRALFDQDTEDEKKIEALRASILEQSTSIGSITARIQAYDAKEETYNQRYKPGFVRNILGEYEPAALEIRLKEYEKELDECRKASIRMQRESEDTIWKQKENDRNLEDAQRNKMRTETQLQQAEETCRRYEQELKERRTLLRYFGLEPSDHQPWETSTDPILYQMDRILSTAEHKLAEIELSKRKLEKEEDQLQKEYQRLTQGRVLELPAELETFLDENGISYVYGMEWLKKNQYTEADNRKLVQAHPFLPYALLLSGRNLAKLAQLQKTPYTSFPIPLMLREQLEQETSANQDGPPVLQLGEINFYILFNKHLLNEEALKQMAEETEQLIAKRTAQIRIRREEYASFFEKKEQLKNQQVTRELEEAAKKLRKQTAEKLREAAADIQQKRELADQLAAQQQSLQQQIQHHAKLQSVNERRLEDLKDLERSYTLYVQDRQRLDTLQREQSITREKERLALESIQKRKERERQQELHLERLRQTGEAITKKVSCYAQYESRTLVSGPIEDLENRYQAITSQLSLRQQEIERLLQSIREKLRKRSRELARRQKKYRLSDGEWKQTVYDPKAEEYQEQLLSQKEQQFELKRAQWNEADKNAALAGQRLDQQKQLLLEKCRQTSPLAKEEIQPIDFDAEIEKQSYAHAQLEQEKQLAFKRIGWYEETLTALAEYMEFLPSDETELWHFMRHDLQIQQAPASQTAAEPDENTLAEDAALDAGLPEDSGTEPNKRLSEQLSDTAARKYMLEQIAAQQAVVENLSGEELRRKKGSLVRDYNHCQDRRQKQKERLTSLLNQMVRMEIFAQDFYRKPIESMLLLTDQAGQVIRQLQTTLQSYESLMEKIQVDIAVIEEEKQRISELLGEYVQDVHRGIGRIDANSTIPVRDKSIKMLKILLPDWEENANLYQMRLRDFLDETTQKGIELLARNENAQEYFGARMTTKNLYDVVVGIENVQIRLYKIEEQREYPITWSQVAKNSGGEGFLSAFIILSSLMHYMRKDDSDLFADRNEGKVLVMDNPFAQTNASHLLKPLMDMAKKTNTQLICLSGLGGESIYNRFDNIYVLNLIAARLRSGTQYLKAEHMRGSEAETMLVSQIEVLGQQELLF